MESRADIFLGENLCCAAWLSTDRAVIKNLSFSRASGAHPVSGVFAQLGVCLWDCDCILNFGLCVRLAYLPPS